MQAKSYGPLSNHVAFAIFLLKTHKNIKILNYSLEKRATSLKPDFWIACMRFISVSDVNHAVLCERRVDGSSCNERRVEGIATIAWAACVDAVVYVVDTRKKEREGKKKKIEHRNDAT